jgi:DNA repair ATPase RecN
MVLAGMMSAFAVSQVVIAGPLPLEQLKAELSKAKTQLVEATATANDQEARLDRQARVVDTLGMIAKMSGTRADYQAYREAKAQADRMRAELDRTQHEVQTLNDQIDFIQVQIEAWEEINGDKDDKDDDKNDDDGYMPHDPGNPQE